MFIKYIENYGKCYKINPFISVPRSKKISHLKLADSNFETESYEEYGDNMKRNFDDDFGGSSQNLKISKFNYQFITNIQWIKKNH